MAKSIPDKPSAPAAMPVASEGILSAEEQAIIDAAHESHIGAIKKIKDPKARWTAALAAIRPYADLLLDCASAYPGAAPFMSFINGVRQNLGRIEMFRREEGARSTP